MSTVTIAVDLARNVFEIAVAGRAGTIKERKRLSRAQFEQFWGTRSPCRVVMEACSTSHFWARYLIARGFEVTLIPPHKQGDPYVRMLLIHGARSALNAARRAARADKPVTQLQAWALQRSDEMHSNKAVVALANKLARIAWAVWYHEREFNGNHVMRVAA